MLKLRLWLANRLGKYGGFLLPKNYLYIRHWFTIEEIAKALEEPLRILVFNDSELKSIFQTIRLNVIYSTKEGYTKTVFYNPINNNIQEENKPEGWYFWDELGLLGGGPYKTEEEAIEALNKYAEWLEGPTNG